MSGQTPPRFIQLGLNLENGRLQFGPGALGDFAAPHPFNQANVLHNSVTTDGFQHRADLAFHDE